MAARREYAVDLVMCIDCTYSMVNLIEMVKDHALNIHADIKELMAEKGKQIRQIRARIVAFRDFYAPRRRNETALEVSDFFLLPEESLKLKRALDELKAIGGGSLPENGLEALALAMRSPWTEFGGVRRQVIVLWTDASAHPLEARRSKTLHHDYPDEMPADFDELTEWWETQDFIDPQSRRLLMFAPDEAPWNTIAREWEEAHLIRSHAGYGLSDLDYTKVIEEVARSIIVATSGPRS